MAGIAPLSLAARPVSRHATSAPTASVGVTWISLADVKARLNLPLSDSDSDPSLRVALTRLLADLEKHTGRSFASTEVVFEFGRVCGQSPRVLNLEEGDLTITAVNRVASDGTKTLVPSTDYAVLYDAGIAKVRLNTGVDAFQTHADVWCEVTAGTQLDPTSASAQVAAQLILEVLAWEWNDGDVAKDPRRTAVWQARARGLSEMAGVARALRE